MWPTCGNVCSNYSIAQQSVNHSGNICAPSDTRVFAVFAEYPNFFTPQEFKTILKKNSVIYSHPGQPRDLSGTADRSTIVLRWTAPSNGGTPITSYTVSWGNGSQEVFVNMATITYLLPNTSYTFKVIARNAVGKGPASVPFTFTTGALTVPDQPTDLSGTAGGIVITPNLPIVTLTWTAPSDGGTAITSYTINWTPGSGSLTVTSGTTATITDLTPNTEYTFTVLATNAVGSGPASAPYLITTSALGNAIWALSSYAGGGTLLNPIGGYCDGSDIYVQYNDPRGVATDANGNIYVADRNNYRIRKIDSNGVVTTIAGDGTYDFADGQGTNAKFRYPNGVATDANGNIYVADSSNNRIRKIDLNGFVTTIAGDSVYDFADNQGTNAKFRYPNGVATDANGNIYVADSQNNRIRKIDSIMNVTTIAGDGTYGFLDASGIDSRFREPQGILTDSNGNIYVADTDNNRIRKIDSNGLVTTIAGGETPPYADGSGIYAQFIYPIGVATDSSGNIYVADTSNNRIRKIDSTGLVTTIAGSTFGFLDASGIDSQFRVPTGVALDSSGNIYVADSENHRIRKIDSSMNITTIAGSTIGFLDASGIDSQFKVPTGVETDSSGNIYVADRNNHRIRKIDSSMNVTTIAGDGTRNFADGSGTEAKFNFPQAITRDSSGNIYVADTYNYRIRKIDSSMNVTTIAGTIYGYGTGVGTNTRFAFPRGITTDSSGNIYVADSQNKRIRKIDSTGYVTPVAGGPTPIYIDAIGTNARFNSPNNLTRDSNGNIYVADSGNHRIRKIDSSMNVTTIAGDGTGGYGTGVGTNAQFAYPYGITRDSSGNIYIADSENDLIRKIDSTRNVTSTGAACNVPNQYGYGTGLGMNVRFAYPNDIALDSSGNIYVADTYNHRIRKIDSTGLVTTLAGDGTYGYGTGVGTNTRFAEPKGLTRDANGNIYVADSGNHRIRKIDSSMNVTTIAGATAGYGTGVGTNAQFAYPNGLTLDTNGNIYVADTYNNRICKIDSSMNVTTIAGDGSYDFADGSGTEAKFKFPQAITRDSSGNIYVADTKNNRIRKIDSSMNVTTIAGTTYGYGTGVGTNARFAEPNGVAADSSGNIYVADTYNNLIRMIDSSMNVITLVGGGPNRTNQGSINGLGTNAMLNFPTGVALDANGNIYVADTDNHTIKKLVLMNLD